MLTLDEMAHALQVSTSTVKNWSNAGLLRAERWNDKGECLYAAIGTEPPRKQQGNKLSRRLLQEQVASNRPKEV